MIKYNCDGCGAEISAEEKKEYSLGIINENGHNMDLLDLCKSCNVLLWKTFKKHSTWRDKQK